MKAKPHNLSSSEDGTAGKRFNYTTTLSVETVLAKDFFLPVKQNLMPGDEISVRRTAVKQRFGRMFEMLTLFVTEVTVTSVNVEQVGKTLKFKHKDIKEKKDKPPTERYAAEGWKSKEVNGSFSVFDEKGKVVAEKLSQEDAQSIVTGNKPVLLKAA